MREKIVRFESETTITKGHTYPSVIYAIIKSYVAELLPLAVDYFVITARARTM